MTNPNPTMDVRAPARVASGRIDAVSDERFHNIVGSQLLGHGTLDGTGIDPELPIAVVCGLGNDSKVAASHLTSLGCSARSLRGGMTAWMKLAVARELPVSGSLDRFVQFDRVGKGALGYLLVSGEDALIVDPPRDAGAYLQAVGDAGAKLVGVADTHVHADYLSGGPAIAEQLDVPYYLHPADAVYPYDGTPGLIAFTPLEDGQSIEFGRCSVVAKHTPGHTEGSLSFLVDGAAALTGDFLFVESVGRPDLAGKTNEWAGSLWESIELAKRDWPLDVVVYPAHYASDRERRDDGSVGAPLLQLLGENEALQYKDRDAFVQSILGRVAAFPDAYRKIKAANVGLLEVEGDAADELEIGRNECALGGR
jgi:glyoxylase-like metal-dependent hydrolase (beta-lactamase superfamily II)